MKLNSIPKSGLWDGIADFINENFNKVDIEVESLKDATVKNCGYFSTLEALQQAYPKAGAGSKAYVGASYPYAIYLWDDSASAWVDSGATGGEENVKLEDYYTKENVDEKVAELESYIEDFTQSVEKASSIEYPFIKGEQYKITSLSQSAQYVTLTTRATENGETIDTIGAFTYGMTKIFTPTTNANYLRMGNAITIKVIKVDSLADANENIVNIKNDISDIKLDTTALEYATASATVIQYPFKVGNTYKITSLSQSAQYVTLTTRATENGETIDTIGAFTYGMTKRFTPTTNANYLRISNAISIKITKEGSLIEEVESLYNHIEGLSNDLDNEMFNLEKEDWYVEKSFNVYPGFESYFFPYLGKTNCKFIVEGLDSAAFRIQGTNKATGSVINLASYTSGVSLPIEFSNPRPELEFINIRIDVPSASDTKGILNVKIVKDSPLKKVLQPNWKEKSYGCYPFGVGINYQPTILDIPAVIPNFTSLKTWYDLYDALVSQYPNYVSKEDCDATFLTDNPSVVRPDALSELPIYLYKFLPSYPYKDEYQRPTQKKKLKVFITTGTHPEYISMWSCYQGMKAICEQWRADENFKALRWNVEIYIIPCSGPWGITNATRTNYNGVDLNRNMASKNWVLSGQVGDNTYSGPSAGSEYESKLLAYYIDKINPTIFVDYHNFGANKGGNIMFGSSENQLGIDIMTTIYPEVCAEMTNQYQDLPNADSADFQHLLGYFGRSSATGARSQYACDRDNCIGVTHETFYSFYWEDGVLDINGSGHIRDSLVCSIATNSWLRVLLRLIKNVADRWTAL